jgi:uncharacterized membrane protein YeaQ/YmgE (transglycosylase-associated protein family)
MSAQTPNACGAERQLWRKIVSILAWLVLGLIAGFIGSKIVNSTGQGILIDIVLGIVGAFVGGFLFTAVGAAPVTGLNLYSLVVAVVGSVVVLVLYHAIAGRSRTIV